MDNTGLKEYAKKYGKGIKKEVFIGFDIEDWEYLKSVKEKHNLTWRAMMKYYVKILRAFDK